MGSSRHMHCVTRGKKRVMIQLKRIFLQRALRMELDGMPLRDMNENGAS
jgi:hypothetical protein